MQKSEDDADGIGGYSVSSNNDGEGGESTQRTMLNGEAEPSYNEISMAPVASAEKMLRGGMKFGEVVSKTGLSLREIALDMESRGESVDDIRGLTGLYRDDVGGSVCYLRTLNMFFIETQKARRHCRRAATRAISRVL